MQKVYKLMNDNPIARWAVLILVASMMFFAYMFVDVMSPLKSTIEKAVADGGLGWDSSVFGTYAASEYFLNVFCLFLIFAGIILDKMGVRFTGLLSAGLMVIGASIKFVGISDWFQATAFCGWLDSWWVALPGSAKMACLGFMIFGCGCEMAGTTVSKVLAKWFKGKEMALAMGLEMAIARLGVFAVMWIAPIISAKFQNAAILAPLGFCTALLLVGLITTAQFSRSRDMPRTSSSRPSAWIQQRRHSSSAYSRFSLCASLRSSVHSSISKARVPLCSCLVL